MCAKYFRCVGVLQTLTIFLHIPRILGFALFQASRDKGWETIIKS